MESYLSGTVTELEKVTPGSCIIFSMHEKARLGFFVEIAGEHRGILDVDAKTLEGAEYPAVYLLEHLGREKVFVYAAARIVPVVEPDTIGFGYHGNGRPTRALYLTGSELIVQASLQQHRSRVNVTTGRFSQADVALGMHCLRWQVEAPNANGDYRLVKEYLA